MPTLVADGTIDQLDPVTNSDTLATLVPGARLHLHSDAGYALVFRDQASFVSVIFLRAAR